MQKCPDCNAKAVKITLWSEEVSCLNCGYKDYLKGFLFRHGSGMIVSALDDCKFLIIANTETLGKISNISESGENFSIDLEVYEPTSASRLVKFLHTSLGDDAKVKVSMKAVDPKIHCTHCNGVDFHREGSTFVCNNCGADYSIDLRNYVISRLFRVGFLCQDFFNRDLTKERQSFVLKRPGIYKREICKIEFRSDPTKPHDVDGILTLRPVEKDIEPVRTFLESLNLGVKIVPLNAAE